MAKLLKLRRGTTTQHSSFTGAEGEVTVDTDKETLVVHDGSTAGGHPVAAEDMANVSSSAIAGRLSNDSIAVSKIAAGTLPSDVKIQDANVSGNLTIATADINADAVNGSKIADNSIDSEHYVDGSIDRTHLSADLVDGSKIADDSINSEHYVDGSIDAAHLATDSVTNAKIAHNAVYTNAIQNDAVTNAKIADDAVANAQIADDAVNTAQIATNAVTADSIAAGAVASSELASNAVTNVKVSSSAAIAGTKISPDFGSQNIATTGNLSVSGNIDGTGYMQITGTVASFYLTDSNNNPDYVLRNNNGEFLIRDDTNNANRIHITTGTTTISNNLDCSSGVDVTGNISVTGTVDGRDVASDGSKLDGIESGATADQTGSEIASALSGQNIYTSGGIGRDSTDYLQFANNTECNVYINGNNEFRFEADGDFHADGDVVAFSTTVASDRRLKENIEVIPNALDKVQALNGVSFDWKKTGEKSAGVIAQEVQGVLPEAVKEVTPIGGGDSHLSVNYHALTSILIESIKELKAEIEQLKGGQ